MKLLHKALLAVAAIPAALSLAGCDDATSIGSALVTTDTRIVIEKNFTLEGRSVANRRVPSRTAMQLIGDITADDYGTFTSEFVTQFLPVAQIDSNLKSAADIDSVKMLFMFQPGNIVGDSVIPMGLEIYRLDRQLTAPLYSDIDPTQYYNPVELLGSKVYGASNLELPTDSLSRLTYREIYVDLPVALGRELFDIYKTNPDTYLSPTLFAREFPGVYVRSNYGSGRVTQLGASIIQLYYHYSGKSSTTGNDTIYRQVGNFYSATPEIISNNIIHYAPSANITSRIARGECLIVAPAGYEAEITFPIVDIINRFKAQAGDINVINDLTLSIPATSISNTYGIEPPKHLLMVPKSQKDRFFEKSEVSDGVTSFRATFNEASATYDFESLRNYFLHIIDLDNITPDDYTFILTPVTFDVESVYNPDTGNYADYVNSVTPYVQQPAMARLDLANATIVFTFSVQDK